MSVKRWPMKNETLGGRIGGRTSLLKHFNLVHTHSSRAGELKMGPRLRKEEGAIVRMGPRYNPLGERAIEHP